MDDDGSPSPVIPPVLKKPVKTLPVPKKPVKQDKKPKKPKKKLATKKATSTRHPRPHPNRDQDNPSRCDQVLRESQISDKFATNKLKTTECTPARFLMLCNASAEFGKPEYNLARFIASRAAKISALGSKFRIQHPLQSSDLAGDYILLSTICKLQKTKWWVEGQLLCFF